MKKFISFILVILMLSAQLSVPLCADDFEDPDVELGVGFGKFFENYGYEYLTTLENGENMQDLYDKIDTKAILFDLGYTTELSEGNMLCTFTLSKYGVNSTEAEEVWQIYKNDHPLYYWMDNDAEITDTSITVRVRSEYVSVDARRPYSKDINDYLEQTIGSTEGIWSAYTIVLIYRDALLRDVEFAYESDGVTPSSDHAENTILGAYSIGEGTSTAYAKALQLLLDYSEVESIYVTGRRDGIPHSWNLVKLDDGKWYWVDLTLDDEVGDAVAFCLTEEEFFALPYEYEYNLPTGVGEDYLYELPERSSSAYDGDEIKVGDTFTADGFTYAICGYNKAKLVGMSSMSGSVEVPESVSYANAEYTITSIGAITVEDCDGVTTVTLPASIERILGDAFTGLGGLRKVCFCGDAPVMNGADSDEPSFDAERVVFYVETENAGWYDSQYYNAGAKTWMGYRIRTVGEVSLASISGEILYYDGANDAVVALVSGGETVAEITLTASGEEGQNARTFTLNDVEDGVYGLVITAGAHLSYTVTGIEISGEDVDLTLSDRDEIATLTLIAGDANRDGCVDLRDVTELTSSNTYGLSYEEAASKSADINGDECFDLKDLTIITSDKNYGKADVVVEY